MPAGLFVNIVNFFGTRMHITWRMLGANDKNGKKPTSVHEIVTGNSLVGAHRAKVDVEDLGRKIMETASTKEFFSLRRWIYPSRRGLCGSNR